MQEKVTYKTIKQSVHFDEVEWAKLKSLKNAEEKKFGYHISVNKFLRKLVLKEVVK